MKETKEDYNELHEEQATCPGFVHISEDEKLRQNIFRSPIEKLSKFTRMLKREAMYKKPKIIQNKDGCSG